MSKNIQHITEWSGTLNSFPITLTLRVRLDSQYGGWWWDVEVRWEEKFASEKHWTTNIILIEDAEHSYPDQDEAYRFGEEYVRSLGFQLKGEVQ